MYKDGIEEDSRSSFGACWGSEFQKEAGMTQPCGFHRGGFGSIGLRFAQAKVWNLKV